MLGGRAASRERERSSLCMPLVSRHDPFLQPIPDMLGGMSGGERALFASFLLIATAALVLPPYYGYRYAGNFWVAMFSTNDAATCMAVDLCLATGAFMLFLYHDMRSLRFSLVSYLVVVCTAAIAISFPIPLYFAFRVARGGAMAGGKGGGVEPRATIACSLTLIAAVAVGNQVAFNVLM